jgi:hypothetical protein
LDANAERIFLDLLEQFMAEGRNVCANPGSTYATRVFAAHANGKGLAVKALVGAMDRLIGNKKIKVETFGPPSKRRSKLVVSPPKEGDV